MIFQLHKLNKCSTRLKIVFTHEMKLNKGKKG